MRQLTGGRRGRLRLVAVEKQFVARRERSQEEFRLRGDMGTSRESGTVKEQMAAEGFGVWNTVLATAPPLPCLGLLKGIRTLRVKLQPVQTAIRIARHDG